MKPSTLFYNKFIDILVDVDCENKDIVMENIPASVVQHGLVTMGKGNIWTEVVALYIASDMTSNGNHTYKK